MGENSYGRALIDVIEETPNDAGGTTITITGAFESPNVDYSDKANVEVMATYAVKTAEGLYSLVHEKCDTENALANENQLIEMYISFGALACEIYLKALIYYNGHIMGKIKTHNLKELYQMLPEENQNILANDVPMLRETLNSVSEAFVELRYVFEMNVFNKEYLIIFDFMDALHEMCKDLPKHEKGLLLYGGGSVRIE